MHAKKDTIFTSLRFVIELEKLLNICNFMENKCQFMIMTLICSETSTILPRLFKAVQRYYIKKYWTIELHMNGIDGVMNTISMAGKLNAR